MGNYPHVGSRPPAKCHCLPMVHMVKINLRPIGVCFGAAYQLMICYGFLCFRSCAGEPCGRAVKSTSMCIPTCASQQTWQWIHAFYKLWPSWQTWGLGKAGKLWGFWSSRRFMNVICDFNLIFDHTHWADVEVKGYSELLLIENLCLGILLHPNQGLPLQSRWWIRFN